MCDTFTFRKNPAPAHFFTLDHYPIFWISLSMGINLNPENCQSSPTSSQICLKPQFPFFLLPHAPERNQIRAHGWHGNERGRERCRWRIDEVIQCRVGGGGIKLSLEVGR